MEIRIPDGIFIGHADNDRTGVTVILAPDGAVCGADVRGGAPGTRETDLLRPEKTVDRVNAVVLAGGSAYGLESCCGVMHFLRERNKGYAMGDKVVPIVCGAVIYDLLGDGYAFPDTAMGYAACENALGGTIPVWGRTGCGKGATVGKMLGAGYAQPGGIGAATVCAGDAYVTAVIAVNACGDIYKDGRIVAGTRSPAGGFADACALLLRGGRPLSGAGQNTTIGCLVTNARLDKTGVNKLASRAHDGLARAIRPVHTDYDGDTLFAMSAGCVSADSNALSVAATEAVEKAVVAAVDHAGH